MAAWQSTLPNPSGRLKTRFQTACVCLAYLFQTAFSPYFLLNVSPVNPNSNVSTRQSQQKNAYGR